MRSVSSLRSAIVVSVSCFRTASASRNRACSCGSAGTYNILQPVIADRLRERKVANIERVHPDVIATGNIGCMTQIALGTRIPIVHTVELLDWATGGPLPPALEAAGLGQTHRGPLSISAE